MHSSKIEVKWHFYLGESMKQKVRIGIVAGIVIAGAGSIGGYALASSGSSSPAPIVVNQVADQSTTSASVAAPTASAPVFHPAVVASPTEIATSPTLKQQAVQQEEAPPVTEPTTDPTTEAPPADPPAATHGPDGGALPSMAPVQPPHTTDAPPANSMPTQSAN